MISLKHQKRKIPNYGETNIPKTFPGISSYSKIKILGFCPAVKMNNTNHIYVCKSWRFKPMIPALVSFCGIFFLIMSSLFLFPHFGFEGKIANFISFFFIALFFITYFQTIFIGPGFFPFFWSEQTKNRNGIQLNQGFQFKKAQNTPEQTKEELLKTQNSYNLNSINDNYDLDLNDHDDDSPSGIITNQDQLIWAKSKQRPPRSVISKEAGRIIIRPDHFCGVTLSWIGKRNQKFFLLFNLYATLYISVLFFYALRLCYEQIHNIGWCWRFDFLFSLVIIVVGFQFGGLSFCFALVSFYHSLQGTTILEENMKIGNKFNKGVKKNLEDICGPCWNLPCWLCPSDPWKGKTNDELVKDYVSYYDKSLFTNEN